jgi:DAACS family dicarboxylate/amino acid:cation (Na+ or H+) symporter
VPPFLASGLALWRRTPLYLRILAALAIGVVLGVLLGERAGVLSIPSRLVLQLLSALAPPLILLAVIDALLKATIRGRSGVRMVGLLLLNTLVAICIGLAVANVVQPGRWQKIELPKQPDAAAGAAAHEAPKEPLTQFLDNVPRTLLEPLVAEGRVLGVILLAVAFGLALRHVRDRPVRTVGDLVEIAFATVLRMLHWVIEVIPLAVLGIVASVIGEKGFAAFLPLLAFVAAVLLALLLQASYYLARVWWGSWVRPLDLLRGGRDALVLAFSTASSTATMPVTYECLRDRVGLRDESARMGALVGANFNNDGTALYEAMSALFISQMLGRPLGLTQQIMVVLTSIVASVGAAGIPEAGLVTMTLVFQAVGLPVEYIGVLLAVDWFLDRCRTAINVMGDMNVACLLDGRVPPEGSSDAAAEAAG